MRWVCWWRPPCLLKTVLVNLKDDETTALEGVLYATRGPWWTLKNGSVIKAGEPPAPVVGDLIVHRDNVAFLQVAP
jgi:hypothetical protein